MPNHYKPPVTRDEFHYLEAFYFRLVMYTDSDEFWLLTDLERGKINAEIAYMNMYLNIMGRLFSAKGRNERPVVAWPAKIEGEIKTLYRFSCITVAAQALGTDGQSISAVCKGRRKTAGGYRFQYEENCEYNFKKDTYAQENPKAEGTIRHDNTEGTES